MTRAFPRLTFPLMLGLALALPLAGCERTASDEAAVAELDKKLVGSDRIVVDPALASGKGGDVSIEALDSAKPMRAPKPAIVAAEDCTGCESKSATTLGERAADEGVTRGKGTCDAKLQYGAKWAGKMPPEFPVYPRGKVKEAAGVDGGICDIRVASFTTPTAMQNVVDYYYTRARMSGYSAEYQIRAGEHVLGGVRDHDGGAYFITFNAAAGGGTAVDIVANNGR